MSTQGDQARMSLIEQQLDLLAKAINNMATKRQTVQLNLIRQKEINSLTSRIESLETTVASLEAQIATLL